MAPQPPGDYRAGLRDGRPHRRSLDEAEGDVDQILKEDNMMSISKTKSSRVCPPVGRAS